ncbi:MAG TPA: hypothetical protein VGL66_15240 [Caulobacteraceae bacterium]|jgi:hypothetical protein
MESIKKEGGNRPDRGGELNDYLNLKQSLRALCSPLQNETVPLSYAEIVDLLVAQPELVGPSQEYLQRGEGASRDPEAAAMVRERLAWALVERCLGVQLRP